MVLDEAIAVHVAVLAHPRQRGLRVGQQAAGKVQVARPAHVLAEGDEEQRRRVHAAVVGAVRHALQLGQLAQADLVEDLAWLLITELVDLPALMARQEP